jgi:DNA-directed RNA polymerase subunit RPC12/RpoP
LEIHKPIDIKPGEVRCPRCRARDIVPSKPRGLKDDFMQGMGRIPRHCRSCGKRFYVPDPARVAESASSEAIELPK